ncbi:MAG TPA: VOC family protein [Chitinophagaceae bacterium]|nr:VOC family protein [Chitinophagaceae bacterium]HUM64618.1 VOC family protein [Chitinophagaceae bacterium]
MVTVNPYLNFNGTTEAAFNFYRSVFGGDFITLQRFKDTAEADRIQEADRDKIMHVALMIGKGTVLMGTDALESMGHPLTVGNNFFLSISAESEQEAENYFEKLSAGGKISIPLKKTFWGAYFGIFTDKFGIQWMIDYDYSQ